MKQSVVCVIQLGKTIHQIFHPNFLNEYGDVLPEYLEYAEKAHHEIYYIQKCLNMDQSLIDDDEVWNALQALHTWKKRRIAKIKKSLERLSDGTFTFDCEEQCSCHPKFGGECDACLRQEKMVLPEAINCARYRAKKECNKPILMVS